MNHRLPLRTLVVRTSSLGDVVLAAAVPRALKACAPEARVTFLTKGAYAPVLLNNPFIDEVLTTGGRGNPFLGTLRLGRELRSRRFDLVVDLQANPRSFVLCRLASPRKVVRARKDSLARHGMVRFKGLRARASRHSVQRYLSGLQKVFGPVPAYRPRIHLTEREKEAGFRLARGTGVPGAGAPGAGGAAQVRPTVAICPGARWKTKMWGEDRMVSLALRLVERGFQVLVIGGPSDEPALAAFRSILRAGAMMEARASAVTAGAGTGPDAVWQSAPAEQERGMRFLISDLRTVASVMAHCACVVSNDSGLMHVAHSVDAPVVAIFGPTTPEFGFFPPDARSVVFSNEFECKPCDVHGTEKCKKGRAVCMESVEVEEVADAVTAVTASRNRPVPGRVSDTLELPAFRVRRPAAVLMERRWRLPETGSVAVRVPNWVGDAVMARPALAALSRLARDRLVLVAHKRVAGLFQMNDVCREVLVIGSSRWPAVAAAALRLRRRKCGLGVTMPDSFSSALLLWLAGVPRRVGFRSEMRGALLSTRLDKPGWLHLCEQYSHLLPAGAEYDGRVHLPVSEADLDKVRRLLERKGVKDDSSLVLLAPGASYGETKIWPAAGYVRLSELMGRSEQALLAFVGTAGERELCESMRRESRVPVLNLAGETSLGELAALCSMATLFVGNDSGAAHVAAAVGCPVVIVVGSTDPGWTTPRGDVVAAVQKKVSCSPCFLKRCPYGLECLTRIDAECVHEVAVKLRRRSTVGLRTRPD